MLDHENVIDTAFSVCVSLKIETLEFLRMEHDHNEELLPPLIRCQINFPSSQLHTSIARLMVAGFLSFDELLFFSLEDAKL